MSSLPPLPPIPAMDDDETKPAPKKKKKSKVKYKKAPQAPKRFKSAFIFFSTAKHKEIREQLGEKALTEKTTSVAKMVSEAWRNHSAEDREQWEEMARKDKDRYEVEKQMYTGPWKVPKRKLKNPDAPKRPMSSFLAFSNDKRRLVKGQHPEKTNAQLSKVLAKMWEETPQEERQVYIDEEYRLRQKYLTDIAVWREKDAKEMEKKRQHREEQASAIAAERRDRGEWRTYAAPAEGEGGGSDEQAMLTTADASPMQPYSLYASLPEANPVDEVAAAAGLVPAGSEPAYYQEGGATQSPYLDAYYQQLSNASAAAAMPYSSYNPYPYPYRYGYQATQSAERYPMDQGGIEASYSSDGLYPSYSDLSRQEHEYWYQASLGGGASQYGLPQTSRSRTGRPPSTHGHPSAGGGGYGANYYGN